MILVLAGIVLLMLLGKEALYWVKTQQVFLTKEAVEIMVITSAGWLLILIGMFFL